MDKWANANVIDIYYTFWKWKVAGCIMYGCHHSSLGTVIGRWWGGGFNDSLLRGRMMQERPETLHLLYAWV